MGLPTSPKIRDQRLLDGAASHSIRSRSDAELGSSIAVAVVVGGSGLAHFGMQVAPFQQATLGPTRDAAVAALGQARFDEQHRIGSAMSADEAAGYALGGGHGSVTTPTPADHQRTSC